MAINFSNDVGLAGIQQGNTANRPQSPVLGLIYYNTQLGYFESYTENGWFTIAASPTSPTAVTATNVGTSRAYNNGSASVAFTPNTTGGPASSFIIRPSPTTSPATFTGSASPVIATNLASSTQYTYTVVASSTYGNSSESSASSGVTATTVPQSPTIGTATLGDASATVAYTAGATGGAAATFTATSSPGGLTGTGASPITVSGLTNGTSYTFTVTATNSNGTSTASAASNSVVPNVAILTAYQSIATATVPAGGVSSVSFTESNSSWSDFTHLQIRASIKSTRNSNDGDVGLIRFNSDSANNYWTGHAYQADGSSASTDPGSTYSYAYIHRLPNAQNSNVFSGTVIDLLDFKSSNSKVVRYFNGYDNNGTANNVNVIFGDATWNNSSPVTSMTFSAAVGNIAQYSTFALYGIKG